MSYFYRLVVLALISNIKLMEASYFIYYISHTYQKEGHTLVLVILAFYFYFSPATNLNLPS